MTEALLETLRTQAEMGKRADGGWKPEAWTAAKNAVVHASRNRIDPSVDQVKSKLDGLKVLWKEWVMLSKQSGFGWKEELELYEAEPSVWKEYLKVIN